MKKVAILGNGLSASFAIMAFRDFSEYSKEHIHIDHYRSSEWDRPPGAVWVHWLPFPLRSNFSSVGITIFGVGASEDYAIKQWGKDVGSSLLSNSFPGGPSKYRRTFGFDAEEVKRHCDQMVDEVVNSHVLKDEDVKEISKRYDLVVQTFPSQESLKMLAKYRVKFPVSIVPDAECTDERSIHVIYNGKYEDFWIRRMLLRGNVYTEYSHLLNDHLPESDVEIVRITDLRPDCPEWNESLAPNVVTVGRLATWKRKYLSHYAYKDVMKHLENK